jgi:hypothetical protein
VDRRTVDRQTVDRQTVDREHLDLTALGRQEAWEEPKGRAVPLGPQVGGPAMRLPDEYAGTVS